jgi:predicted nucleic acid-binding protein
VRGVLVDAGPLVALVNRGDTHHARCVEALKDIRDPLLTVWPAVTEAMFLVRDSWPAQAALLEMLESGAVELLPLDEDAILTTTAKTGKVLVLHEPTREASGLL